MHLVAARGRLAEKAPPVVTAAAFQYQTRTAFTLKSESENGNKKLFLELILESESQIAC